MDYFQLGYISKIELPYQPETGSEFYLPLRLVIHSEVVTIKIRPVSDAPVHAKCSLN